MNEQNSGKEKDKRVLVLFALGAGILLTGWFAPKSELQSCDYYQLPSEGRKFPVVARTAKGVDGSPGLDRVKISAETSCADTPPRLSLFFDLPLPINRADFYSMTMLSGIGKQRAEDIISLRREHGKISGLEALTRVDGIGKKLAERLSPMICFD
ncbi:MAG: helix-hairpin-helix domain-containing protein [Thermodesulfobacteriota bacterium]|nr:helix-hairpin-helix domain-containing protein [Thermodesulfobacteriota bacterium]